MPPGCGPVRKSVAWRRTHEQVIWLLGSPSSMFGNGEAQGPARMPLQRKLLMRLLTQQEGTSPSVPVGRVVDC